MACATFRVNPWRRSVCANCYLREDAHRFCGAEKTSSEDRFCPSPAVPEPTEIGDESNAVSTPTGGADAAPQATARQPIATASQRATTSFEQVTVRKRQLSRKASETQQRPPVKSTSCVAMSTVPESISLSEAATHPAIPNPRGDRDQEPGRTALPSPRPRSRPSEQGAPRKVGALLPRSSSDSIMSSRQLYIQSEPTQTPTHSASVDVASSDLRSCGADGQSAGTRIHNLGGRADDTSLHSDAELAQRSGGPHLTVTPPQKEAMAAQRPNVPPRATPRSSRASSPSNAATTPTELPAFSPVQAVPTRQATVPPAAPVRRVRSATMKAGKPKKEIPSDLPSPAAPSLNTPTPPLDDGKQTKLTESMRESDLRNTPPPPRKPERSKASYGGSPLLHARKPVGTNGSSAFEDTGEDALKTIASLSRSTSDVSSRSGKIKFADDHSIERRARQHSEGAVRPRALTVVTHAPLPARKPPPPPRDDSAEREANGEGETNAGDLYAMPGVAAPEGLDADGREGEYDVPRKASDTYKVPKSSARAEDSNTRALRRSESGGSIVKNEALGPPPPLPNKAYRPPLLTKPFNRHARHTVSGARPTRRPPPPPGENRRQESNANSSSPGPSSACTSPSKEPAPSAMHSANMPSAMEDVKSNTAENSPNEATHLPRESTKSPDGSVKSSSESSKSPRLGRMFKHLPSSMSAMRERTMSRLKPRSKKEKKAASKPRDSSDEEPEGVAETRSENSPVPRTEADILETEPERKFSEDASSAGMFAVPAGKPPIKPVRSSSTLPQTSSALPGSVAKLPLRDDKSDIQKNEKMNTTKQTSLANVIASALASPDEDSSGVKNTLPLPPRTPPARGGKQQAGAPVLPPRSAKNPPPPIPAPYRVAKRAGTPDPVKTSSPSPELEEDNRLPCSDGELMSPVAVQKQLLERLFASLQADYMAVNRSTLAGLQNVVRKLERVLCGDKRRTSTTGGSVPAGWRQVDVLGCEEDGPHGACCVHVQSTIDSAPMTIMLEPLTHHGDRPQTELKHDYAVRSQVGQHISILRTLRRFEQPLPSRLLGMLDLENSREQPHVSYVTDSLAEFSNGSVFADTCCDEMKRNPADCERQVALLMVQLCSALTHLHRHGVVHRNVGLGSILIGPMSDSCSPIQTGDRLLLTSLGYSLSAVKEKGVVIEHDGLAEEAPIDWFLYPRNQLAWFDTNIEAMPREVRTAADRGEQLNYSACDAYSCGYLIRDLLGKRTMKELADCASFSVLCKVALGLLQEAMEDRLSTAQARRMLECFLWGPTEESVPGWQSKASLTDVSRLEAWLHEQRTNRLAAMSLKLCRFKISLEDFLHCRFLAEITVDGLITVQHLLKSS